MNGKKVTGFKLMLKTSVVSGMTLLSRILGLVRDIVFARFFGASLVMDAFLVANRNNRHREGTLFLDPGFPVQKQQCIVLGHAYRTFDV